jgi:hypothetical protein
MKRAFSPVSFLTGSTVAAGFAIASTLTAVNPADAFTLSINPNNGSTENTGSTALLDFNFVQDGNNVKLNLDIKNTTNGSAGLGATASTLVGVGLDLPSLISSFTYNSLNSAFTQTYSNVALNPLGNFDYGIRSAGSGNFVGGNPQEGLTAGQSTLVSFLFSGTGLTAQSVESAFFNGFQNGSLQAVGRFQQVNAGGGSDKVLASLLTDSPSGGTTGGAAGAPEPTTMLGASIAAGLVALRKRKKAAKA